MALGGSSVSWDEATPAGSESVGLGDNRIRSMKTSVRNALDSEHVFGSSGGTIGQHRAGSARAFFGTQSRVSASDTSNVADGRMMVTSDSSRLFGVNSEGTVLLAPGPRTPSFGSQVAITFPQRAYIAMEYGNATTDGSGNFSITFPGSGFSGIPAFFGQVSSKATPMSYVVLPRGITASAVTGDLRETSTGGLVASTSFDWFSIGTRTL